MIGPLPSNRALEADICIVGAGAAGLLIAREFVDTDVRVIVLESGGYAPGILPDPMYHHDTLGLPIALDSRVRAFGGTTTVWSRRWKPLDPIDFEKREWIPHSGWPLTFQDLLPYYRRADSAVEAGYPYEHAAEVRTPFALSRAKAIEPLSVVFLKKSARDWGKLFANSFQDSRNISVYLNAHVTELVQEGKRIVRIEGHAPNGGFVVTASRFVLAQGGIENARQLLLARVGNEHDQVGRYFMEHPKNKAGVIHATRPLDLSNSAFTDREGGARFGFRLRSSVQHERKLLNPHILFEPLPESPLFERLREKLGAPSRFFSLLAVRNYFEQAPVAHNRVTLGETLDPFGKPYAKIEDTVSKDEIRNINIFHELLSKDLSELGVGELTSPYLTEPTLTLPLQDASHHVGTTRMGDDPSTSVVDPTCRVHSTDNLFVAGSSVFPTGGSAGPTATIVALAIRLADHLKSLK